MKALSLHTGIVLPIDRPHVDTDQIIPKQFLKSIKRTGFQDNLFDSWRYLDEGHPGQNPNERQINPDFILNQPRFQDASILLAQENFGCGSSREHAVWALYEYGIRVILAPSFADIFFSNCFKNGLLPIALDFNLVNLLFEKTKKNEGFKLTIDLPNQLITLPGDSKKVAFEVDPFHKRCLLEGLNEIDLTLSYGQSIRDYEAQRKKLAPWLFTDLA